MAINLKEMSKKPELLAPGHRACAGCGGGIALRQVMRASKTPVVVSCATGCMEVVTTIYPYTAWRCSFIHNAFENSAPTMCGIEAAWKKLNRDGKVKDKYYFIAFGGDGATFDIGMGQISGFLERGHRMLYVCYDNQAYMNTGTQRSSATPMGANVTTAPAGAVHKGKEQFDKNLTEICAAHEIPYVAQASIHNFKDLMAKVQKAQEKDGPAFLNILASCNRGWRVKPEQSVEVCRLGVETCFWPLYEVDEGVYKLNYKPKEKLPIGEWAKLQGRFAQVLQPENKHILDAIQEKVDKRWEKLLHKCEVKPEEV
ncbi:MAG: pyruvate ferredoxin oxidoreductase [Planctomycetota bacterium]|nr:MAG: pyruvate ferredoxin oxidoreductase [Planctomycetota bacterium]